ncbi:MAG: polysaccharide deacetylase family protein, partial [Thermodesulfobacteriota bacterium]
MNKPGIGRMQRAIEWFSYRFTVKGLILMYHSINEWSSDPWSLSVTPSHFAEHLEVLQKYGRPMQLQQFIRKHRFGITPRNVVVVTLDDGYADNLINAKPLLEHYNIPATVFLTTGYIGSQREFWWDELDRLFLQPGKLPEVLCLKINGSSYEWKLDNGGYYSEE